MGIGYKDVQFRRITLREKLWIYFIKLSHIIQLYHGMEVDVFQQFLDFQQ